IQRIQSESGDKISAVASLDELADVERELVGKGSALTEMKRGLGALDADDRKAAGAALNAAQKSLRAAIEERRATLEAIVHSQRAEAERLDLTEVRAGRDAGHL